MLQWIAANKDLLIALFGAGGAGAVLLTVLVRKGGEGGAKGPSVTATAGPGGVAGAHGGIGDIDLRVNEAVGAEAITGLQQRLGLSLAEAARLLKAFRAAGLDLARGEAAVARVSGDAAACEALVAALRGEDTARAAAILAGAAGPQGA